MDLSPIDRQPLTDLRSALGLAHAALCYLAAVEQRERELRADLAALGPDAGAAARAVLAAEIEDVTATVTLVQSKAFIAQRSLYERMASMLQAAGHPW